MVTHVASVAVPEAAGTVVCPPCPGASDPPRLVLPAFASSSLFWIATTRAEPRAAWRQVNLPDAVAVCRALVPYLRWGFWL